jgi:hypothetical protein
MAHILSSISTAGFAIFTREFAAFRPMFDQHTNTGFFDRAKSL